MMNLESVTLYIKCISALCIVAGCTGIGFLKSKELMMRIEALQMFGQLLLALQNEIRYLSVPIPEIFEHLLEQCPKIYGPFLKEMIKKLKIRDGASMQTVWQEAVQCCLTHTCLKNEDIEFIKQIGKTIGYLDVCAQLQTLELQKTQLEEVITEERGKIREKQRVYQCMGIFVGFMCVLCFL